MATRALFFMHTATLFFGLSGLFGRITTCSAQTLVAGRALFAILALALLLLVRKERPWTNARTMAWFVASGLCLTLHFVFFFQGIKVGGVAIGTLGFACFPAITALFEVFFFHERMTGREWQALLGVALGLWLLVPEGAIHAAQISDGLAGLAYGVLAALVYAFVALMNRALVTNVSSSCVSFWQQCVIVAVLLPLNARELIAAPKGDWLSFAFLGIFCTALAYSLYVTSLRSIPARQAALIISLEPVYTIALAWLLLGEVPAARTLVGGFCILAAVLRLNLR